jgi:hypothetical protein
LPRKACDRRPERLIPGFLEHRGRPYEAFVWVAFVSSNGTTISDIGSIQTR